MSEPTDDNGFRLKPQRPRSTTHNGKADDIGWFYEEKNGISVYVQDERTGRVESVLIPRKALERWVKARARADGEEERGT